jgi:hypothetical protein
VLDGTFAIRSAVVRVARIAVTVLATLGSAGVRSERKAPAFWPTGVGVGVSVPSTSDRPR